MHLFYLFVLLFTVFQRQRLDLNDYVHSLNGWLIDLNGSRAWFERLAPCFERSRAYFERSAPCFERSGTSFERLVDWFERSGTYFEQSAPCFEHSRV